MDLLRSAGRNRSEVPHESATSQRKYLGAGGAGVYPPLPAGRRPLVLLDTGLAQEREELEQALLDHGLTPAGILCSHAHVDHGGNNRYFQEKYHIPVALTSREAGMCASLLSLKCYFLLLSPDMVEQDAAGLVHTPDVLIPDGDGPFSFAGAEFQILQTPGHSVGHISTLTPDRVCYVGDALLSREQLDAKLPYWPVPPDGDGEPGEAAGAGL